MKRLFTPGRWSASGRATPDTSRQCCDGRCTQGRDCPLTSCKQPAPKLEPVHQRPAVKYTERALTIVICVVLTALVTAGAWTFLAPLQTTQALTKLVGQR